MIIFAKRLSSRQNKTSCDSIAMGRQVLVCQDAKEVSTKLKTLIENIAREKLDKSNVFKIGLSGGSLIKSASQAFSEISTEWNKWRFFFCDERLVPFNDKESTFGLYKQELIGKIPINEDQFIVINPLLDVVAAADDYVQKMKEYFEADKFPEFDLLLLGIGPDGHTCSLFPGHDLLKENSQWVASISDSPKPPPNRITLTLPVLNSAHNVIFLATGAGKAPIVKEIFKENSSDPLPAARISPSNGELYWLLDRDSSSLLGSL